jgi:hypothetical protein
MSFRQDAARIRRQLAARGFSARPRCPTCSLEVEPRHFAPHSRQCLRDCASLALEAINRRLAVLHAEEPRGPEHKACIDTEETWLSQEHRERFNELCGLDAMGRGKVVVADGPCPCGNPECRRYDTAF